MDDAADLPVLPGRLQRLADELVDEGMPAFAGVTDRIAALVELAYALRPQRFEGRVPTYGVLLPPRGRNIAVRGELDTPIELIPVADVDVQFARRLADGAGSFAVRRDERISHVACFGRNMSDEYDLVRLQGMLGGSIVQRHAQGQVRMFGPAGIVRWDGVAWHWDAPLDAWIGRLRSVAPNLPVDDIRPLLRFALHVLGAQRIGATLIWRPLDDDIPPNRHEPLVHNTPRLRLDHVGEEAALRHALAQTDGAALFDATPSLVALGIRLAPSTAAERGIEAMRGMRHTSALRYSHDDPEAIVIVVSTAGPVTLMHRGRAVTSVDPTGEQIG